MRFSKASEEQIPKAIHEETTKRVNCYENGNLPLFYIEKDTRVGVLYAPFACVLMVRSTGLEPARESLIRSLVLCVCQFRHDRINTNQAAKPCNSTDIAQL